MAVTSFMDTVFRRRKKKFTEFINVFEFDFDTIRAATDEFSDRIALGGSASVYKGRLESGEEIAVKILVKSSTTFDIEFLNEIELLSKLKHKNLIRLLGFCCKRDQQCLVFEFTSNLSLDSFIFDSDPYRASQLNWEICRNIVQGIARGLRYLHEESGLRIIHRDICPRNIFLDSDLNPKIGGFGFAMLKQDGENEAESIPIAGTLGYLDPDYIRSGIVSFKSDAYAFGITILTIISRRRAFDLVDGEVLITYVERCWNRGESINVIHETMREEERENSIIEMLRYIHIALLCVDENAEIRPSLDEAIHWLRCSSTPLPEPTIGVHQSLVEAYSSRSISPSLSLSPSLSPGHSFVMSPMS